MTHARYRPETLWKRFAAWLRKGVPGLVRQPIAAALVGYVVLTLLITYPAVAVFSTHQAGDGADSLTHLWILWWTKTALFDLHVHPNEATLLYYPQGDYNPMLFVTPLIQLLSLPFQFFLTTWEVYNLFLLASFVLAGLSAFLLCHYITKAPLPSFLGGLIFAFSPFTMAHAGGHFIQLMTFPFPLYALALLRMIERPTWKRAIVLGIVLGLALQVHLIFDAYLILPLSLVFLWRYLRQDRRSFVRALPRLIVAGAIALLLWLPFLWPLLNNYNAGWAQGIVEEPLPSGSDDLVSFFLPIHSFLLRGGKPLGQIMGSDIALGPEQWAYLGIVPCGWALYGAIKRRRQAAPWLALAAVALVIGMGPVLQVGGKVVTIEIGGQDRPIPLPYALLQKLPFLQLGRNPGRAAGTLMLALAVLAGLGAAALRMRRSAGRYALLSLAIPLLLLEYWTYSPFPTAAIRIPEFYRQIAADPEPYAVLDYPLYAVVDALPPLHYPNYGLLYQIVHRHPMVGGHVWRTTAEQYHMLWGFQQNIEGSDIVVLPQANLRAADIRYVVLHKFSPYIHTLGPIRDLAQQIDLLKNRVGAPVYEDDEIIVYETRPPEGPFVAFGPNWYGRETVALALSAPLDRAPTDSPSQAVRVTGQQVWRTFLPAVVSAHRLRGYVHRWIGNEASLQLYLAEETCLSIALAASAYQEPRCLNLVINGRPLDEAWEVAPGPYQRFRSAPVLFPAGKNEVVLQTETVCTPIDEQSSGAPSRCLSLDILEIRFYTQDPLACSGQSEQPE